MKTTPFQWPAFSVNGSEFWFCSFCYSLWRRDDIQFSNFALDTEHIQATKELHDLSFALDRGKKSIHKENQTARYTASRATIYIQTQSFSHFKCVAYHEAKQIRLKFEAHKFIHTHWLYVWSKGLLFLLTLCLCIIFELFFAWFIMR